ncbi:MAG: hypothetical protein ACE5KE_01910 [Methanosarcinales archaeon]
MQQMIDKENIIELRCQYCRNARIKDINKNGMVYYCDLDIEMPTHLGCKYFRNF